MAVFMQHVAENGRFHICHFCLILVAPSPLLIQRKTIITTSVKRRVTLEPVILDFVCVCWGGGGGGGGGGRSIFLGGP